MNYITIDFETANRDFHSTCSVGLVRFIDSRETDSCHALIKPPSKFFYRSWTETVHHICYEDVKNEPHFPEIWNNTVMPFIMKTPGLPLAAHNGNRFDMKVIRACCDYYKMPYPQLEYFDTLHIAEKAWPELKSHSLPELCRHFGIIYNAHHALDDARACGLITAMAATKLGAKNVYELLCKCGLTMGRF